MLLIFPPTHRRFAPPRRCHRHNANLPVNLLGFQSDRQDPLHGAQLTRRCPLAADAERVKVTPKEEPVEVQS
jgi:hypothetical protein